MLHIFPVWVHRLVNSFTTLDDMSAERSPGAAFGAAPGEPFCRSQGRVLTIAAVTESRAEQALLRCPANKALQTHSPPLLRQAL